MKFKQTIKTNMDRVNRLAMNGSIDPPRFYIADKYGVVFIDNPKVASTSVKQMLYSEIDYDALGQEEFHAALENRSIFHVPPRVQNYTHFFIVRNPFSRLVSAWRNKVEGRPPKEWGVFNVKFYQLQFRLLGKLDLSDDCVSFEDFAMAVTRIPDWISDRHLASQSRWMAKIPSNHEVRILRFESLATDWNTLAEDTGLPELSQLNKTQDTDWCRYYTSQELVDAVKDRYQSDLNLFGYSVPDPL